MIAPLTLGPLEVDLAKAIGMALLAVAATIAAHAGAAVYQDGLRTSIPELWQGGRDRQTLARFAWTINIGFIVAYALPYSLATGIIVIHIILLGADVIGLRFERRTSAVLVAAAFGLAATIATDVAVSALRAVDPFQGALAQVFAPMAYTFPLLAAVAIASVYGLRWGVAAAVATAVAWRVADAAMHGGGLAAPVTTAGGGLALLVMTAVLGIATVVDRAPPVADLSMYDTGARRIVRAWPLLVVPPVLIAVLAAQGWLAGEPLQLALLALDEPGAAAAVALFSTLAFVPMIAMSGLLSGVWNQDGYPDWYLAVGYLAARNPVVAALGGLVLIAIEIASLRRVGAFLNTHPRIHTAGSAARDALDTIPTYSVLAGAVGASAGLAGPLGPCVVVGAYALNDAKGRPVMPLAVPMFAFLAVVVGVRLAAALPIG
jgi:Protein of unknown function